MAAKRRWMASVIATSAKGVPALPFQRARKNGHPPANLPEKARA